MKLASGSRPLAIRIFAAAFLVSALIAYLDGLGDIPAYQALLRANVPEVAWSQDAVIVTLSARLSIALIPIALVWLTAANFARWMVTVLALGKLINVPEAVQIVAQGDRIDPAWTASLTLGLLAVAMLFTPASNRWFAHKGEVDPAVFE
ncbi:MAG: hypothetical protein CVT85_08585 [Alphaproteobacteria bacterium HGW-Alphaproteobacteria-7]|jgi:hypothetical protein|nr:MAG: hypothetical protein CVT85_08585 [Alphaproteobacteria bacterium HGW-Alphaproteobacteria-7]